MVGKLLILGATALIIGISSQEFIPKRVEAVKDFDQKKYLGTWYEIARLDYKWEKGLDHVSATYSLNDNGSVRVDNKGYDVKKKQWKESVGRAKPVGDTTEGRLKVSFFGLFYAGYNIVAIDEDYRYALVIGGKTDYMWLLSREKTMPEEIKQQYLQKAKDCGVKTEQLIWVNQNEKVVENTK
jgi:apolipoprotein D and lipocalin family protein